MNSAVDQLSNKFGTNRIQSLDVIRGVAVLLVIGRHITHTTTLGEPIQLLIAGWYRCGWIGVDMFFVLSGFLVSGLIFEEWKRTGGFSPVRFLIRRGFKIYPAFYTLWLVVLILELRSGHGLDLARLMNEALFIQNYSAAEWHHTWSLAVEEHFYFGLTLLTWLRVRAHTGKSNPFIPLVWLGFFVIIACIVMRWQIARIGPFALQRHYTPTHLRMDSLMVGVIVSWFWAFRRERVIKLLAGKQKLLAVAGILLLSPTLYFLLGKHKWLQIIGFTELALGTALLILAALLASPSRGNWLTKAIATVGLYSYSIYLWNLPLVRLLDITFAGVFTPNVWLPVYIFGSIAIGIALGKLIEWPALHLRDKWFPRYGRNVTAMGTYQPVSSTIIQPQP